VVDLAKVDRTTEELEEDANQMKHRNGVWTTLCSPLSAGIYLQLLLTHLEIIGVLRESVLDIIGMMSLRRFSLLYFSFLCMFSTIHAALCFELTFIL
jgi:hypothetical protein